VPFLTSLTTSQGRFKSKTPKIPQNTARSCPTEGLTLEIPISKMASKTRPLASFSRPFWVTSQSCKYSTSERAEQKTTKSELQVYLPSSRENCKIFGLSDFSSFFIKFSVAYFFTFSIIFWIFVIELLSQDVLQDSNIILYINRDHFKL
jgi:hypothetical protein